MSSNFVQSFSFKNLPIHGTYVVLTDVWEQIRHQRKYHIATQQLLGELLLANLILVANLKTSGRISAEIRDNSKLKVAMTDCTSELEVRAMALLNQDLLDGHALKYTDFLNEGTLVFTLESKKDGEVYQSIVEFTGKNLPEALNDFMLRSEHLKTVFVLQYSGTKLVGVMFQQVSEGISAFDANGEQAFADFSKIDKSLWLNASIEEVLATQFAGEEIIFQAKEEVVHKCACSKERVSGMIAGMGKEEVEKMIKENENVVITCDFCNTAYEFSPNDIRDIFNLLNIDDAVIISKEVH